MLTHVVWTESYRGMKQPFLWLHNIIQVRQVKQPVSDGSTYATGYPMIDVRQHNKEQGRRTGDTKRISEYK